MLLGAGILLAAGSLLGQASRPSGKASPPPRKVSSSPATPYQKLLAELKAIPPPPGGRDARVKVLRKWFVPRDKARHRALQELLLEGTDRESRVILLGFLKDDLPVLLAGGRPQTPEGKIFLGYLDPLISLAGGGDQDLARRAVKVLLSLPYQARRERFQVLLREKDHPLFSHALKAAGFMQDLGLAPLVAPWLKDETAAPLARASLQLLTFQDFRNLQDFQDWWKKNRTRSWEEVRDQYLNACLDREKTFQAEKEAYARKARKEVEKELLPLVEELVATRVAARRWKEPLALLEKPLTRAAALAGIVRALKADPGLMAVPQGEEGKAFRAVFDLLLRWARKGEALSEDLLLGALSHLSDLPPAEKDLRVRALACLKERAVAGPVKTRLAALPLLAAFSGKEADQVLLDLLSKDSKEPEILYKVISLLKDRELTPDKGLPANLGRAQERLEQLLVRGNLPRRVRTDAILFFTRWPYSLALSFLEKVLLGKENLGAKLEDRLAAADALQDILQRFRQKGDVVGKVQKILVAGLTARDPKKPELARLRAACAEKLGSDFFLDRSNRKDLAEDLKKALLAESSPAVVESLVTTLLKLGLKAAKVSDDKALDSVRSGLVERLSKTPSDPKERDWIFNALLELSDADPVAKMKAGYAFGRIQDRAHALPFFAEITAKLPLDKRLLGTDKGGAGKKQASILMDHFCLLVTGRLYKDALKGAALLKDLSLSDLEQAGGLLEALDRERSKGNLPGWGTREFQWEADVLWRLATAKREAHEAAAPFFRRAASAIQVLLAQAKLGPKERGRLSLRRAEALLEGGELKNALVQLRSLAKNPDLEKNARPLLAKALEAAKAWAEAGAQWAQVAASLAKGSPDWWLASLKQVECLARAGKIGEGRKALSVLLGSARPGNGPDWKRVIEKIAGVKTLLSSKTPPSGKGKKKTL